MPTVIIRPNVDVLVDTYDPANPSVPEGKILLDAGQSYSLKVYGEHADVSPYTTDDELLVRTKDLARAAGNGELTVEVDDEGPECPSSDCCGGC
jgi:hypothetical protein